MKHLSQKEAFELNSYVESFLEEEETFIIENLINDEVHNELTTVAKKYLDLPKKISNIFWRNKGRVHEIDYIQQFSKKYIEPNLKQKNVVLIGDTAFCISTPPHDIHVDNRDFRTDPINKKNIIGYKTVVLPLEIDTEDYPVLYTANQYFYGPTTRFRKGNKDIDDVDEECKRQKTSGIYFSYDYRKDGVKYLSPTNLSKEWYDTHIDYDNREHSVPYSSFEGFSIEKELLWKPRNVLIFDSSRIHFGENITKKGATYKLGISLNYGIKIS